VGFALLLAALCFHGWLLTRHHVASSRRWACIAAVALLALAVVVPPRGSRDIWIYASAGRLAEHYHASPYSHRFDEHPDDPFVQRMAPAWRKTRSAYGPAFTALSAVGMRLAGASPLRARLFFQGLGALSVLVSIGLIERLRPGRGWVLLGLNPVVALIVNGGHNDLLVGALVLAGALAVRRRPAVAGLVLGLALLVKAIAVLPVAAIVLVGWRRRPQRGAGQTALAAAATTVAGYLALGRLDAVRLAVGGANGVSRASMWTWVEGRMLSVHVIAVAAMLAAGGVAWRAIRQTPRERSAVHGGIAGLAYLLTGAYVMPWYPGAVLPLIATAASAPLMFLAQAQAAVLALTYVVPPGSRIHRAFAVWVGVVPLLEIAALVALLRLRGRAQTSPGRTPGTVVSGKYLWWRAPVTSKMAVPSRPSSVRTRI
jgi:hypothetical protein